MTMPLGLAAWMESVRTGRAVEPPALVLLCYPALGVETLRTAATSAHAEQVRLAEAIRLNREAEAASVGDHDLSRALWEERDRLTGDEQRWAVFATRYEVALAVLIRLATPAPAPATADHPDEVVV